MKVVLMQDIKDLGKKGELVNVADGYGKNYLIPRYVHITSIFLEWVSLLLKISFVPL